MVSGRLDAGPASASGTTRRKTLVERQAEEGSNDPFKSSERVINNVGKQMSSMRAKRESCRKEIDSITAELEFVESQLVEAEAKFSEFDAEANFRRNEHKRLTKFVRSCEERQHKIQGTCRQWKRDFVQAESKHMKNTARQLLQSERGFFSGHGSTMTRAQYKERAQLLSSLPRGGASQTLRPLSGDQTGFTQNARTSPLGL